MAVAAILYFEKLLPILNYLTDRHQISTHIGTTIWNISLTLKCMFEKIQDGGRRHLGFRKTAAISLVFDDHHQN